MSCEPISFNVNTINPYSAKKAYNEQELASYTSWIWSHNNDWTKGDIHYDDLSLTVPLFHRISWSNLYSRAFTNIDSRASLGKGEGLPIIVNSTDAGTLTLKFKYEEKADTDTSLVTLTPDNKIKTYFKDKKFTDASGNYSFGRISTAVDAPSVSLNGTEWTGKEVTVIIDIKKEDEVWMRIDPLTSDGIYCKMTDFKCELKTDA